MSKSSAATASKILPVSAWSRGPPQSSSSTPTPRSQSPAPSITSPPPSASHSRRPSALAQQAVSFKDGVGARSPVNTSKPGTYPSSHLMSPRFTSRRTRVDVLSISPPSVSFLPESVQSRAFRVGHSPLHPTRGNGLTRGAATMRAF